MRIRLNFNSGKPAYLQIVDQVKHATASGVLRAGDGLPPIRPLAEELRVNRNTVAKAYTELEKQGVIETVTGKGAFVSGNGSPLRDDLREGILDEAIDSAIVQAYHFKVPPDAFLDRVKERLEAFERDKFE